jgi:predicted  nucleic acid-binding Zn-ribbon protein
MPEQNHPHTTGEKLLKAYDRMMERVRQALGETDKDAIPRLRHAIEKAEEVTAELGELTREEAEKLGTYLQRDVEDAANYLAGPQGEELADWLRFDVEQVEERILEAFMSVADQTKIDLLRLETEAQLPNTYHSGEITGIGTLECTQCGKLYHFKQTGHIPPCACGNSVFSRVSEEG